MMASGPCWEEQRIERAALRLVDRESASGGGDLPAELDSIVTHGKECARCRDLLALFLDVERQVRIEPAEIDMDRIVLLEVREGPEIRLTERDREEAPSALAADASPAVSGGSELAPRSYASEDGRYRIRVMPNRSGTGATAILVQGPGSDRMPFLRGPGGDHEFHDGIHAALPGLPGPRVEIRFR
ncbi:MAG: hypothetical protein ABIK65_07835 [Candidatus Eisenbacteria bacterium]